MSFTSKSQKEAPVQIATIDAEASLSDVVDISRYENIAIQMPDAWTAADLSFVADDDNSGTFLPVFGADNLEIIVSASFGKYISLDVHAAVFKPIRFLKIRSGTSSSPVVQATERQLKVVMK